MALQAPAGQPYSVKEAAHLLGVSPVHITRHYKELGGTKLGERYLIPRHAVDALVYGPTGPKAPLDRVLEALPVLSKDERIQVARLALAEAA